MANASYTKEQTALIFIDPYNDFLSEGGKLWPMVESVAKKAGLLDNLRAITAAIRKAGIQVFIAPHCRVSDREQSHPDRAQTLGMPALSRSCVMDVSPGGASHRRI